MIVALPAVVWPPIHLHSNPLQPLRKDGSDCVAETLEPFGFEFSVNFVWEHRFHGSVLVREIVKEKISGDEGKTWIDAPSRDYLLLQKAECFIARRAMKARDAFDASLLLAEGAALKGNLHAHLNDAVAWQEFDRERINERIEQITPKLCRPCQVHSEQALFPGSHNPQAKELAVFAFCLKTYRT